MIASALKRSNAPIIIWILIIIDLCLMHVKTHIKKKLVCMRKKRK